MPIYNEVSKNDHNSKVRLKIIDLKFVLIEKQFGEVVL